MHRCTVKCNVIVPANVSKCFAYETKYDIQSGQLVVIQFKNREIVGIIDKNNIDYFGNIKNIIDILPYRINNIYVEFIHFMSSYTLTHLGKVAKLITPFNIIQILKQYKEPKPVIYNCEDVVLNDEQQKAIANIAHTGVTLLHGVTGSGKTEVFLSFIKNKKQSLIIVPEVALSDELAKKVASRTQKQVYLWHHSITTGQKLNIWKKAIMGEEMIVVGARSALFIPFNNLECIVIDEEHDESLKQSDGIIYNARDMAIFLASKFNIPIILSSATPSIETYYNAISNKYRYVQIHTKFYSCSTNTNITISDLRKTRELLTNDSIQAIKKCLEIKKQALIFVNRRGHTPRTICSICGWKITCPNCDAWLCYHSTTGKLLCHYCGHETNMPNSCPKCAAKNFIGLGIGVEKAYAEISKLFSNAKIIVVSSDVMNTQKKIANTIYSLQNAEYDIIIGTQILAKGHNFPNLNTIIVTCVDSMLFGDDFRASEKTFQMLHQISGRAGRFQDSQGANIVYQTYSPDDNLIKLVAFGEIEKFYSTEISNRMALSMPPFGKMCSITLSSFNKNLLTEYTSMMLQKVKYKDAINIAGPLIPCIMKIKNKYRMRFIITSKYELQSFINDWLSNIKQDKNITITIDIDPYNFM